MDRAGADFYRCLDMIKSNLGAVPCGNVRESLVFRSTACPQSPTAPPRQWFESVESTYFSYLLLIMLQSFSCLLVLRKISQE